MVSIRLRHDIRPLCDRHSSRPMTFIFLQIEPGAGHAWEPAYACGEPGCPRHFSATYGYFNTYKQRVDRDTLRRVPCPHDALPMYVESVDDQHQLWNWRCAQFGCDGNSIQAASRSVSAKA